MKTSLRRALALAAATGALVTASNVAQAIGRIADVSVIDRDTGSTLPVYYAQGRYWIAGAPGHAYAIAVHNRSSARVLAVMSVDGVNAVSGETASWDQTGYVFDAGERSDIRGWRKSDSEIAAFEFTSLGASYAARTGRPANVGVIGVALFRERPRASVHVAPPATRGRAVPPAAPSGDAAGAATTPAPIGRLEESDAANEAQAMSREDRRASAKLGTGHGAREDSWVEHTAFERARNTPDEVITLHYDSRENLIAMGVIQPIARAPQPNPFPGAQPGYVPDPPAWR